MSISETIREEARKVGLCDQHYQAWNKDWTISDMVQYFLTNPTWCMQKHFPTIAMWEEYADSKDVQGMGVFVKKAVTSRTMLPRYVFIKSTVGLLCGNVCRIFFSQGCKAKIIVENGGILMVDVYDDCQVEIETKGTGRATVFQYGSVKPILKGSNTKLKDKR